jgi:hypothetical protein
MRIMAAAGGFMLIFAVCRPKPNTGRKNVGRGRAAEVAVETVVESVPSTGIPGSGDRKRKGGTSTRSSHDPQLQEEGTSSRDVLDGPLDPAVEQYGQDMLRQTKGARFKSAMRHVIQLC